MTYDNAGNMLSRKKYSYTTGTLGSVLSTQTFTYGKDGWGDVLTKINSTTVTSDASGNMLSDGTNTYTWKNGRQLATVTRNGATWTNTYDASGMRTQRVSGSTVYAYIYDGGNLNQMTVGSNALIFTYGINGQPMSVNYNGTDYYYITNSQGDVVGILNSSGTEVVTYTYDAWGNILSTGGTMASTLGAHNPLRYRSYVYDRETGLYYLQSRYYNPTIGRFISADSFVSTGQGVLGYNMFAYCRNNPVIIKDPNGHLGTIAVVGIVVSGFIGGIAAALNAMASGKEGWEVAANAVIGAGVGAATAAVAAVAAVAMATGAVTATAGAVAVTAGSAGIGFVGDGLSQLTDYAFHKNDPDYNYDWRASVTSLAYSTVINASSGLLSLGINISFADKADEIAGLFVAGEASTILGAIDFGIRQAINAIIELF